MKSNVKKVSEVILDFPKLMVSDAGRVVLFTDYDKGMLVGSTRKINAMEEIGYYSDNWCLSNFKDFKGSITLEN